MTGRLATLRSCSPVAWQRAPVLLPAASESPCFGCSRPPPLPPCPRLSFSWLLPSCHSSLLPNSIPTSPPERPFRHYPPSFFVTLQNLTRLHTLYSVCPLSESLYWCVSFFLNFCLPSPCPPNTSSVKAMFNLSCSHYILRLDTLAK